MCEASIVKYVPFQTAIHYSFWYKLTQLKLDVDKLSEERKHIWGSFTNKQQQTHNIPFLEVDCTSFNKEFHVQRNYLPVHGHILNRNTIEQFKDCNKFELIDNEGSYLIEHFKSGRIFEDPSLLNSFFILSFADLKKYHYYFWFAFPTPLNLNVYLNGNPTSITDIFNADQLNTLLTTDIEQKSFFIIEKPIDNDKKLNILTLRSVLSDCDTNLLKYEQLYFAFSDSCPYESNPGWPMRNYVAFLFYCCPNLKGKSINILSYRLDNSSCAKSLVFNVKYPDDINCEEFFSKLSKKEIEQQSRWTGWLKNDRDKFGPKFVDLSDCLDPIKYGKLEIRPVSHGRL